MAVEIARCIPSSAVDEVLRLLHRDLLGGEVNSLSLQSWQDAMDWFPHLKHRDEVYALETFLPAAWRTGQLCDPQILLHFPNSDPRTRVTYHVDREPGWAEGRRYVRIVGVPLTSWRHENGSLLIKGWSTGLRLEPGAAVMMSPEVEHSPGINLTGEIRYGVYFRWLQADDRAGVRARQRPTRPEPDWMTEEDRTVAYRRQFGGTAVTVR